MWPETFSVWKIRWRFRRSRATKPCEHQSVLAAEVLATSFSIVYRNPRCCFFFCYSTDRICKQNVFLVYLRWDQLQKIAIFPDKKDFVKQTVSQHKDTLVTTRWTFMLCSISMKVLCSALYTSVSHPQASFVIKSAKKKNGLLEINFEKKKLKFAYIFKDVLEKWPTKTILIE